MGVPVQFQRGQSKNFPQKTGVGRRLARLVELLRATMFVRRSGDSHVPLTPPAGELGLTFIGHSSFLAEVDGKRLLFDPVFANRLVVLKRLRNPGVKLKQLPALDWVLVSHAHMDHLNRPSLRKIARRTRKLTGRAPGIIVPAKVSDLVEGLGFREVRELSTWESTEVDGFLVTHTPCQHWGARMLKDNYRGYGGYVVEGHGHSLYHSGDSAYFGGFKEIGRRLHPRIALLPIGAYRPDGYRAVHTSPEEALQAFFDVGASVMVPMHYGTFRLSEEPMEEPIERLLVASQQARADDRVHVLTEGRTEFFAPAMHGRGEHSERDSLLT